MNRSSFFAWRPRTTIVLLGGFMLVLVALVASYLLQNFQPTVEVHANAMVYKVQLADTQDERERGLSGVTELAQNGGLLMRYDTDGRWGIWMKEMLIPIDVVWLDKDKKVVYIKQQLSPETGTEVVFEPKTPSRYVLEIAAGSVQKAGIKVGQQMQFTLEDEAK